MGGRADIYVGFLEVGLRSLRPNGGVLAYIVADRWQRNQYGAKLRKLISDAFSVDVNIVMHDVDAFEANVSAYPAITVLHKGPQGVVVTANTTSRFGPTDAAAVREWIRDETATPSRNERYEIQRLPRWVAGEDLWPAGSVALLRLVAELRDRYGPLEDATTGTKIGIGVATGADEVFVTNDPRLIEPDRLLPLSVSRDLTTGRLTWSGHYLGESLGA